MKEFPGKLGMLLTVYGDEVPNAEESLMSLLQTSDFAMDVIVVVSNSTPDAVERLQPLANQLVVYESKEAITKCLNVGIRQFMSSPLIRWIGFIHPDMRFPRPWIRCLLELLSRRPEIGKVSPANLQLGENQVEREGNEVPFIVPVEVFMRVGLFDENFIAAGAKDDWDLNRRIMNTGLKCLISPAAKVIHTGMATRTREGMTDPDVCASSCAYYYRKWGTHDPPC